MKKNTVVISCFPAIGKKWLYDNQKKFNLSIFYADSSKSKVCYRRRTDAELEILRQQWDATPHLLSGEGYINRIKDELIEVRNPAFPSNYIQNIKLHLGDHDVILVDASVEVRNALKKEGITYKVVIPSEQLYCEWIGRCYLGEQDGTCSCKVKALQILWKSWIQSCIEDDAEKLIITEPNKFLSDYIHTLIK